ncbi:MAG TPA: DUF2235 domain-containing protein [Candidatus Competibacteraceae bacterium]|nr:DUF2235 domain-containing protein [Candidatus Competibacteraceae bacterium]
MAKKIVICFDGTWNTPDDNGDIDGDTSTNVFKLYDAVAAQDAAGNPQAKWYDEGVGTRWYNRIAGGAFGVGLSRNIQQGYRRLVELYDDGDEIYIFGFSRGAYTARSLVGMIRNAGLLKPAHKAMVPVAYSLYRTRDAGADSANALFFRQSYAREIRIKCLGVWDTVGALGIPLRSFQWFNQEYYEFHDTELSGIVDNAFHALAIDEHRENFRPTLWDPKHKPNQRMEQVWFPGAHADVGGGYPEFALADIALRWMMERAADCGLAFAPGSLPALDAANFAAPIHDSFGAFMKGMYQKVSTRVYRPIGATVHGQERVHDAVLERCRQLAEYNPRNPMGTHLVGVASPVDRLRQLS